MDADFYWIIVYLLIGLAVLDLMVGVSNDAVNFLNSAFGSRVARRRTVLIIASLGIVAGAAMSSGMMEVARKGIFNPEMFTFADVIVIFLAVMLADILLLDTFNTFGLPTSTTVSIVFELLGASVAVALFLSLGGTGGIAAVGSYINASSALVIVSGIVLSVVIAFAVGALVQFVSRLVFTFEGARRSTKQLTTLIWSALAVTIIGFFLLLKGLSGAAFIGETQSAALAANIGWIALGVFTSALAVFAFFQYRLGWDLLRIVVLIGTFSLALAFAGNDLVNFIGVPLAGLAAFDSWSGSGVAPTEYAMDVLAEPVRGQTGFLLIAGLVMVVTLWMSAKARSVTETEISLGRQQAGLERFKPHLLSRLLVWAGIRLSRVTSALFPRHTIRWVDGRFDLSESASASSSYEQSNTPAFDLVRASVNLTVASILIAFATTLKLPLSTTYVTFMVAMGTSLADRAWGRDSAVFRVAGVLNVIGGWFATALVAFVVAGTYALLLKSFGLSALAVLLAIGVAALIHSHRLHRRRLEEWQVELDQSDNSRRSIEQALSVLKASLQGLVTENSKRFDSATREANRFAARLQAREIELVEALKAGNGPSTADRQALARFSLERQLCESVRSVANACSNYVYNGHPPLRSEQADSVRSIIDKFEQVSEDFGSESANEILDRIEQALAEQIRGLRDEVYSHKNSRLLLNVYLEVRSIVSMLSDLARLPSNRSAANNDDKGSNAPRADTSDPAPA
jgi:phosphate/sulfate permease